MARIRHSIEIARDIHDVFSFVTTPKFWKHWHPSTVRIAGDSGRSLRLGEHVTEEFRAFGCSHRVRWRVTECVPPCRWAAEGHQTPGGMATLTYTLGRSAAGTLLTGEFSYHMPNPLLAIVDRLIVRQRIASESAEAVRHLKALLENSTTAARGVGADLTITTDSKDGSKPRRPAVRTERR
jgi:uncharacterized protein YndB with AHSA1/START domain